MNSDLCGRIEAPLQGELSPQATEGLTQHKEPLRHGVAVPPPLTGEASPAKLQFIHSHSAQQRHAVVETLPSVPCV